MESALSSKQNFLIVIFRQDLIILPDIPHESFKDTFKTFPVVQFILQFKKVAEICGS